MTVSEVPNVPTVYSRVEGGTIEKSACWCALSDSGWDWNGVSGGGPPAAGSLGGYHLRTHCLSISDTVPGGKMPWRYCAGSLMSPGSNSYSMIDLGSQVEPSTSALLSFLSTLLNVSSWLQLLGGPPRLA